MKSNVLEIAGNSELSEKIKNIIEQEINLLDKYETRDTLKTSEIHMCPRKLLYKSIKPSKNGFTLDDFNNQFAIKKWAKLLKYYVLGTNIVLSDCNYGIVGNGDIILDIEGCNVILKIQSLNADDFNKIVKNGPRKKHILELIANKWLAEIENGLLIYENRDNFEFEVFQIHASIYSVHIIESIKKKCVSLMKHKTKGELISRPYKEESKECKMCDYSSECWL